MASFVQLDLYDNGTTPIGMLNVEVTDPTKIVRLATQTLNGAGVTTSMHLLEDDSTNYQNLTGSTVKVICLISSGSVNTTMKIGGHSAADTAPTSADWDQTDPLGSSGHRVTTKIFTIDNNDFLNVQRVSSGNITVNAVVIEEA